MNESNRSAVRKALYDLCTASTAYAEKYEVTAANIAKTLERASFHGKRTNTPKECPIARYLQAMLDNPNITVGNFYVNIYVGDDITDRADLDDFPEIREFIAGFDMGYYPNLIIREDAT